MPDLLQRLERGEILLGDGAWGTMLMERGLAPGQPPESLNLACPEAVLEVGRLYVEAGADLITTNSFGASPLNLGAYGLEERTDEINRRAVELAREAAQGRACVSASVGPSGRILAPVGDMEPAEARASFARQLQALAAAGPDLVCVETMTDLQEAVLAVRAAKHAVRGRPVMATMTFDATPRGFFSVMGVSVEQAARGLEEAGADIIGSNCGNGIEAMIGVAREFRRVTKLPVAIQANAGLPQRHGARLVYPETPEFMAEKAQELLDLGVSLLGGCCGTTPDHIRAFRRLLARPRAATSSRRPSRAGPTRRARRSSRTRSARG